MLRSYKEGTESFGMTLAKQPWNIQAVDPPIKILNNFLLFIIIETDLGNECLQWPQKLVIDRHHIIVSLMLLV